MHSHNSESAVRIFLQFCTILQLTSLLWYIYCRRQKRWKTAIFRQISCFVFNKIEFNNLWREILKPLVLQCATKPNRVESLLTTAQHALNCTRKVTTLGDHFTILRKRKEVFVGKNMAGKARNHFVTSTFLLRVFWNIPFESQEIPWLQKFKPLEKIGTGFMCIK